jgi:EAL domain-containing protein (putative c-di-GMP-specific phosphodiesterase class I)/FixJ family two-component response regulator
VLDSRFLILDDDPDVGRLMQAMAGGSGIESRFTSSQDEFFRLVKQWAPTHIAVDLVMPNMDGVQVLVGLAERACRSWIIITSGVGDRVLDAAGRSAAEHGLNIAGVLSKPFPTAQLRKLLAVVPASESNTEQVKALAKGSFQARGSLTHTVEQLQSALDNQQLQVEYQPKIDCLSSQLTGFEALVRWMHPALGVLMPENFVPFAERCGLIDPLTYVVIDMALSWLARTFPDLPATAVEGQFPLVAELPSLAINISACVLKDSLFVEHFTARCRHFGVSPRRLILELTESTAMDDPVASLALLTRMRMKGLHLSIDDFGTGYSSMLQLVRLPFSEIKIDRTFVSTALRSTESASVVKSIVDLGHSLGLRVVAEGVEDADTMHYLRAIGCDEAQGYFIAHPMSGELALGWTATN